MFFKDYLKTENSSSKNTMWKAEDKAKKYGKIKKDPNFEKRRDEAAWKEIQPNVKQGYFQVVNVWSDVYFLTLISLSFPKFSFNMCFYF